MVALGAASRWLLSPARSRALALALAAACLALLVWAAPSALRLVDERGTDAWWRVIAADAPAERRVIVVDIDDASLAQVGPWPWPRETVAQLVARLDEAGVSLKLFDMVFADAREGTARLGEALAARDAAAPAVLGQIFALRGESTLRAGLLAGALPGVGCQAPAQPAQGFLANTGSLTGSAVTPGLRAGHLTPTLDADGAVRRVPALVCVDDRSYPALVVAGLAAVSGPLEIRPGQGWAAPAWELRVPGLARPLPLDAQGSLRVPFYAAREALTAISAGELLRAPVSAPGSTRSADPTELLKGAWVIVGASAFGLADSVPTALGGAVTGAEIHAQLLAAALDGRLPFTPAIAPWLQGLGVVLGVVGLLIFAASSNPRRRERRGAVLLPVMALALAGLVYAGHGLLLAQVQWLVGWVLPALALLLAGFALALAEHARSLLERGRLFANLASYVSDPVAEQIALAEPSGDIQAHRAEVTVLVADLQNFSRYCEARDPEDAARVLHRFFGTAEAIIQAHGGVLAEMVGDRLLAVFNGPSPCPEHPVAALRAARELWTRCSEELPNVAGAGLEPLSVSVGLESGTALVGSFGPARRRVHTLLGLPVTVSLRLAALTADVANPVLAGPELARGLGQEGAASLALKSLGSFLLPGLAQPCMVYTLKSLLQPGSAAEQSTLLYLRQLPQQSA